MRRAFLLAAAGVVLSSSSAFAEFTRTDFTAPLITPSAYANQTTYSGNVLSNALSNDPAAVTTLYDAGGFETYTAPGNLGGQNGWVVDSASATRYTVQTGVGAAASKGVRALSTVTDWSYPALNYTPATGEGISVNVDIARTISGTTPSFGYAIDAYGSGGRIARWGLANNGGNVSIFVTSLWNGSTFSPAGAPANIVVSGALSASTFYNLEARFNLAASTWDLYNNNTLFLGNLPLLIASTDLTDADLQVSSNAAATDTGYFDNFKVATYSVPEPSMLGSVVMFGVFAARRHRTIVK